MLSRLEFRMHGFGLNFDGCSQSRQFFGYKMRPLSRRGPVPCQRSPIDCLGRQSRGSGWLDAPQWGCYI